MKLRQLFAAVMLLTIAIGMSAATSPKREFRSVWLTAMGIDWPMGNQVGNETLAKEALIEYIENFKRHNFTGVCLQVRPMADALYRSTLEPWSSSITGTRGKDPGWDPLQFAIDECHKRGMELYAWINPFRINNSGTTYNTDFDKAWREAGWELHSGKWTIFNIAIPEARQHCIDVMREIYMNYAIDGMLFDDYFYPGDKLTETSEAGDYDIWKNSGTTLSIADWRRKNVNDFVRDLYDIIQADRPDMRFGIGPAGTAGKSAAMHGVDPPTAGSDWQYDQIYADPLAWLDDGTIDFISPQIYWARDEAPAYFTPLAEWWSYVAQHFGRHNYISMAAYKVNNSSFGGNNETGWNEMVAQIEIGRTNADDNAPGQIYFSAKYFDGPTLTGMGDWIEQKCYQRPALVPVVDWKERTVYEAPTGGKYADGTLSWDAVVPADPRTIIRYSIYAVPMSHTLEQAGALNGDGIDGEYLVDVAYDTSYTLPEDLRDNHWYAVCVYDGYGNENAPATINYSGEISAATTITSPTADAVVNWDMTATWTAVPGATYLAQVALRPEFTTILMEQADLTEPQATFDLSNLKDNTQCYLRVAVCEPGKLYYYTDPLPFFSPTRVEAQKPDAIAPEHGSYVAPGEVTFSWTAVPDAEKYYFDITGFFNNGKPDFTRSSYSCYVEAPQTELTLNTAALGFDSFAWHIVVHGRRVNSTVSPTWITTITHGETGSFESGYTITTDPVESINSDLFVTNEWYRSTSTENCPLVFESDGSFNRSMVATNDFVFITGRSANAKTATSYLQQYDASTGELIRTLDLADAESVANLPCNQVVKDWRNHIFVIDQTTNILSRAVYINSVDLTTGALTPVAQLKGRTPASARVDFPVVIGDVTSGSFSAFAAVSAKATLINWIIEDGETYENITYPASTFPGNTTNFGIAPRLFPIDEQYAWVDGSTGMPALYDMTTGDMVAVVPNVIDGLESISNADNGVATFSLCGDQYMAFNCGNAGTGSRVAVIRYHGTATEPDFSNVQLMCLLPTTPMGTANTVNGSTPIDIVVNGDDDVFIYVYSPGNGIACYRLIGLASITDTTVAPLQLRIDGRHVTLTEPADNLRAYSVSGALVAAVTDTAEIDLPAPGTYIITADGISRLIFVK